MSVTAMKQALEALEWNYNTDLDNIPACEQWSKMLKQNITALRQAIEQAEQAQPVAVYRAGQAPGEVYHVQFFKEMNADEVLLYTAPPLRQWTGLTDNEVVGLKMLGQDLEFVSMAGLRRFAKDIERAIKEKNT